MIRKFDETEQYDTSMKIIFATNNAHKLSEVQAVLGPDFELVTPRSVGITEDEAKAQGIHGKETTPFLLAKIKDITGGSSLDANIQLVYNNAKLATATACELAKLAK